MCIPAAQRQQQQQQQSHNEISNSNSILNELIEVNELINSTLLHLVYSVCYEK